MLYYIQVKQQSGAHKMGNFIYKYVESLYSASNNDVELFKHLLCEQLGEMNLTKKQLEYMDDKF